MRLSQPSCGCGPSTPAGQWARPRCRRRRGRSPVSAGKGRRPPSYHRGTQHGKSRGKPQGGPQVNEVNDVGGPETGDPELGKFDPGLTQRLMSVLRPVLKTYFRSEVLGLQSFPPGGALVVGNHSGGMFPMDVPIFSVDFYDKFGYDRPVYTLSHDILFMGPTGQFFRRTGYIRANRENAANALRSGGVVIVFPGGDYDAYRPTFSENVIDFNGRKGYVNTAIEAGVPIVPAVSIGGQETQLYLSRGTWLAQRLGLKRLLRSDILPLSFGFPFR